MRAYLDPPRIGLIDVDAATLRSAAGISEHPTAVRMRQGAIAGGAKRTRALLDVLVITVRAAWVGNTPGETIGCGHGVRDDGWRMSSVMVDCPK